LAGKVVANTFEILGMEEGFFGEHVGEKLGVLEILATKFF
jgi:hypothetical protein